tara:strand:- start:64 stop:444 length:381 start_codon:yes stop_codon:yes gene_type:complete
MKIFGVGTDIIKVSRIEKFLNNKKSLQRLFNKDEIFYCKKKKKFINCFAKRFAAKEAFAKALGTGISKGINFNEIVISNKPSGKPFIKLTKNSKKIVEKKLTKKFRVLLSLSDEEKYAVAFVTILK